MPWWDKRSQTPESSDEAAFDDGGSGYFDACIARFAAFGWSIECDARHAVWVKSPDAPLSVGLAPWMTGRLSAEQALDAVEEKIRKAEIESAAPAAG